MNNGTDTLLFELLKSYIYQVAGSLFILYNLAEYGRFAAYYYIIKGMIVPYISLPYRNYELLHV